jgi:hypothetical protein
MTDFYALNVRRWSTQQAQRINDMLRLIYAHIKRKREGERDTGTDQRAERDGHRPTI